MILANLMVGFSVMLVCLIVQAAVAFWSVRYYVRQSSNAAAPRKFIVGIRPLLISMLAMMAGNFIQITLWGILFLLLGELDELYEAIYQGNRLGPFSASPLFFFFFFFFGTVH